VVIPPNHYFEYSSKVDRYHPRVYLTEGSVITCHNNLSYSHILASYLRPIDYHINNYDCVITCDKKLSYSHTLASFLRSIDYYINNYDCVILRNQ